MRAPLSSFAVGALGLALLAGCGPSPSPMQPSVAPSPSGSAGPPAPLAAEHDPRRVVLDHDASLAIAAGAGPLSIVASDFVADGDRVGGFVALAPDACVLVFARGSEGIDDIDLLAFADDGTALGSDEATDPHPGLLLCPPGPSRAYVVARVAAGRGLVAVGAQPVPVEATVKVGKAMNARGRPGEAAKSQEIWPGLDAKVQASRREIGGAWEEVRRVALPLDARAPARMTFHLEADRCDAVLVTPSDETSDLDMQLVDDHARVIGRGNEDGRDRVAVVCSPLTTDVTLELRPRLAAGVAAVVIAHSVPGTEADIQARVDRLEAFPTRSLADARSALAAKLKGAHVDAAPVTQTTGNATTGHRTTFQFAIPEGCSRIDVVGGAPFAGLVADLWTDAGNLLGHAEGGSSGTLFACGAAQKVRVDVEATARPGPVAIEVRKEHAPDRGFSASALAGGRLLARANAGGEVVPADAFTFVHTDTASATSLTGTALHLNGKSCVEVLAATETGGAGVDLRLVDATSREEIASARGMASTAVRACSAGAADWRVELRLANGKAQVLVGTRVLTK